MQQHIRPEGWDNWRDPAREKTAWFGEYRSRGPGANQPMRVKWSRQITKTQLKDFATAAFLRGKDGWRPDAKNLKQMNHPPEFIVTKWSDCLNKTSEWYATDEATRIADNVLLYQRANGGWPKNIDMAAVLTEVEKQELVKNKSLTDTTIDNGASFTQLVYLARLITAKNIERHRTAFDRGLDFLLAAQYENGGFPQFHPSTGDYYSHVTFNDGAMIGVLKLFRDVAEKRSDYRFVDEARRARASLGVKKGLECILRIQVVVQGKRTVWAAQYDETTLQPASARTFEPVALSGSESVDVVRFLMDIREPSPEVVNAVESAIAWFERSKIRGIKWTSQPAKSKSGRPERLVVKDPNAGPLWARFYEIQTNRPIFAGRDGVVRYNVMEVEAERRNGYQWYVNSPATLLEKDYPQWRKMVVSENR
jgi:PelA/Pel-15E family pectate lyase